MTTIGAVLRASRGYAELDLHGVGHAEVVVFGDHDRTGVVAAGRTARIATYLEGPKTLVHRVVREETTDERVAEFEQQLDGLDRLDRSDDARQHAQYAGFSATRREFRRRRFGNHAAIARSDVGVEDGDLSFEAKDRTVYDGDVLDERGVVHQIARREVVGTVDDDVIAVDDVQDVVGPESSVVGEHVHVRVHRGERHLRAVDFAHADPVNVVQDLTLEIRGVDDVHVDDADRADPGRGEVYRRW